MADQGRTGEFRPHTAAEARDCPLRHLPIPVAPGAPPFDVPGPGEPTMCLLEHRPMTVCPRVQHKRWERHDGGWELVDA